MKPADGNIRLRLTHKTVGKRADFPWETRGKKRTGNERVPRVLRLRGKSGYRPPPQNPCMGAPIHGRCDSFGIEYLIFQAFFQARSSHCRVGGEKRSECTAESARETGRSGEAYPFWRLLCGMSYRSPRDGRSN